jgi:parallel beta-helix repeat protein
MADEGRIPVWEPGTIDAPGHYILTRDIAASGTEAIVIQADGVTLDLGGRTISLSDSSLYGIRVDLSDVANANLGIAIRNGRIKGGGTGIYVPSILPSLHVEGIEIAGSSSHGIHVILDDPAKGIIGDVPIIGVDKSLIHGIGGDGVKLADPRPSPLCSLTIAGNQFMELDGNGIELEGCADGVVKDNKIMEFGLAGSAAAGIRVTGVGSARLVVGSNVISNGGTEAAGFVADSFSISVDFLFSKNTISNNGAAGIELGSGQGRIEDNLIVGNGADGLRLTGGMRFFVDGNYVSENLGYGLYFGTTNGHAYRDNFLRGNRNGAWGGSDSTDAGGNIE